MLELEGHVYGTHEQQGQYKDDHQLNEGKTLFIQEW
jgi:hypothetical protein